ncbi:hypothetical protein LMG26691_03449 [Achromobacter animicus]|nr:hypothetical protein LMG26691_03449 [Achromobacter animicus]
METLYQSTSFWWRRKFGGESSEDYRPASSMTRGNLGS